MKKSLQEKMNYWVEKAIEEMIEELSNEENVFHTWKQLRTCQAYVTETAKFYVLRSYDTIVACVRKDNLQAYDFLRLVYGYTATSAQHISKFFHDYSYLRITPYVYRDI